MILTNLKTFLFTYFAFAFVAVVLLASGAISTLPISFGLGLVMCLVLADFIRERFEKGKIEFWKLGLLLQLLIQLTLLHSAHFRLGLLVLSGIVMVGLYFLFRKTADPYPLQWLNGIFFLVSNLLYAHVPH